MKLATRIVLYCSAAFLPVAPVSMAYDAPAAPDIAIPAELPQGHPRIYAFESDRENLLKKIRETKWAGDMYARLEREVKPYVERHKTDPDWIVGRMRMNWRKTAS